MINWEEHNSHAVRRFSIISFIPAIFLFALPVPSFLLWLPDFIGMLLLFWILNQPSPVGLISTFLLGLLLDFIANTPLGLHSVIYLPPVFLFIHFQKQLAAMSFGTQSIGLFIALLYAHGTLNALSVWLLGYRFNVWFWIVPLTSALLWSLFNKLMIHLLMRLNT